MRGRTDRAGSSNTSSDDARRFGTVRPVVQSKAKTVEEYLAELRADRRHALFVVRDVIRRNLPEGY